MCVVCAGRCALQAAAGGRLASITPGRLLAVNGLFSQGVVGEQVHQPLDSACAVVH